MDDDRDRSPSCVGNRLHFEACEVRSAGVNVGRLRRCAASSTTPEHMRPSSTFEAKLHQVEKMHARYNAFTNAAAPGVACAGFCFLNKGGLGGVPDGPRRGILGQFVRRQMLERHYQHSSPGSFGGVAGLRHLHGHRDSPERYWRGGGKPPGRHHLGDPLPHSCFPWSPPCSTCSDRTLLGPVTQRLYAHGHGFRAGVAVWDCDLHFRWDAAAGQRHTPTVLLLRPARFCSSSPPTDSPYAVQRRREGSMLAAVVGALATPADCFS